MSFASASLRKNIWPIHHLTFLVFYLTCMGPVVHGRSLLDDIFDVKSGTGKGSCDAWRNGEINHDLDQYWVDAQNLIIEASSSFQLYGQDLHVQKVANVFFGIVPNNLLTAPATDEDTKILNHVQDWFAAMEKMVTGVQWHFGKVSMFCNSDWLEKVDISDPVRDVKGDVIPGGTWEQYYPHDAAQIRAQIVSKIQSVGTILPDNFYIEPYWSQDLKQYWYSNPQVDGLRVEEWCKNRNYAVTGTLRTGAETMAMTLCPDLFFENDEDDILEVLTGDGATDGSYLQNFQPKALTLVHELIHATQGVTATPDLSAFESSVAVTNPDGSRNINWPGRPENLVATKELADSVEQCALLAQAIPRQPSEINAQNYAWAALAIWLGHETRLDWATGTAHILPTGFSGPSPPPIDGSKVEPREREIHLGKQVRAYKFEA